MATIYCDSNAAGANNGTSWTDAYTAIASATAACSPSTDVIWLASDHSETLAAALGGAVSNQYRMAIISVNSGTDVYEPASSPQLTSAAAAQTFTGMFDWYGCSIQCNDGLNFDPGYNGRMRFYDCTIEANASNSGLSEIHFQGGSAEYDTQFELYNCTINLPTTGNIYWQCTYGSVYAEGCTFSGAMPVYVWGFCYHAGGGGRTDFTFVGCDLSSLDFTTNTACFLNDVTSYEGWRNIKLINCKLWGSEPAGGWFRTGYTEAMQIELLGSSLNNSGDDNYAQYQGWGGKIETITATYCDTGYVGVDGSTRVSHKVTTPANNRFQQPIYSPNIIGYVSTSGSKTFTVELASDFATALTDQDIRLEILFPNNASYALAGLDSSGPKVSGSVQNPVATGSTLTTSSQTWTGASGLGNKQKISVTATVARPGMFIARLVIMGYEASKVIHYNPYVAIS